MFTPRYSLAMICLSQNKPPGIFWCKQIVAKLYRGYILAWTNRSKTIPGIQFGYDFGSETVPEVCFGYEFRMVEYVCLLHWSTIAAFGTRNVKPAWWPVYCHFYPCREIPEKSEITDTMNTTWTEKTWNIAKLFPENFEQTGKVREFWKVTEFYL